MLSPFEVSAIYGIARRVENMVVLINGLISDDLTIAHPLIVVDLHFQVDRLLCIVTCIFFQLSDAGVNTTLSFERRKRGNAQCS